MEKGKKTKGLAKLKGEHEAVVMAACGVVSLCYGDMSLSSASGVAMSFGKISDVVRGKKSEHGLENPKEIDKIRDAVLEAYNAKFALERDTELRLYVEAADTALAEHLVSCSLSRKEIVDAMTTVRINDETQEARADFSQVATDLIMDRLAIAAPQHFDKAKAKSEPYHYARNVVQIGVNAALTEVDYFKQIEPQAIARLLGGLAEVAHEQKEQGKVLGEIAGGVEKGFENNKEQLNRIEALLGAQMVEKGLASKDTPHQQLFAALAKQFDSPLNELMGVIGGVLKRTENPDNFGQFLQVALEALKISREEYHRLSSLGNEIAAEGFEVEGIDELLKQADTALNDPDIVDLTTARAKLREARKQYDASVQKRYQQQQEKTARMLVAEAKLAQADSDVDEAVDLLDEALTFVEHDKIKALDIKYLMVKILMSADIDLIWRKRSVALCGELLDVYDKNSNPSIWSEMQDILGNALHFLGAQTGVASYFQNAINAFRLSLDSVSKSSQPNEWATTQGNLSSCCFQYGSMFEMKEALKIGLNAADSACEVWTIQNAPERWANVSSGKGHALMVLGILSKDDKYIDEAEIVLNNASRLMQLHKNTKQWSSIQLHLANIYGLKGQYLKEPERIELAIKLYSEILLNLPRRRNPSLWGKVQFGLGNSHMDLSILMGNSLEMEYAIGHFLLALEERRIDNVPFFYHETVRTLEEAQKTLTGLRAQNKI